MIMETPESIAGEAFRAAGGAEIPNLGMKALTAMTEEGHKRGMKWTVCDVRRPLISVAKVVEAGNDVFLESKNPRIVNLKTKQVTKLKKKGGVYVLDLWVHADEKSAGMKAKEKVFHRPK